MSNALQRDLARLVSRIEREDGPRAAADPYRQRFHLMPPAGWMNDPNGLCRCGEWYHVFYQYGPFDPTGGVKLWGHYRSRDLLRWEQLPPMLYPDQPWDIHGVYSGSALVEDGTMYLYYTGNVKHAGDYDYITSGARPQHRARRHPRRCDGLLQRAAAGKPRLSGRPDLPCARPQGVGAGRKVLYGARRAHQGRTAASCWSTSPRTSGAGSTSIP